MNSLEDSIFIVGWYELDEHLQENVMNFHYISADFLKALHNLPSQASLTKYKTNVQLDDELTKDSIHRYEDTLIGEGEFRYYSGSYTKILQELSQTS